MQILTLLGALILGGVAAVPQPLAANEYGEGIKAGQSVPVSDVLAEPEKFVDQEVQVEGVIVGVCSRMGCWIEIAAAEKRSEALRLKVEDGVMVFSVEVTGQWAQARGKLRKMELTEERARARAEHFAEENGEEFNPETIQGPQTIYQLDGLGVLISSGKKAKKS